MASKIYLVQNDSRPRLIFNVRDRRDGSAVDLSGANCVFQFAMVGAPQGTIAAAVPCELMTGWKDPYGDIQYGSPYDVPGAGGRCFMDWSQLPPLAMAVAGDYLGALQIFFQDGSRQTINNMQKFSVRPEF